MWWAGLLLLAVSCHSFAQAQQQSAPPVLRMEESDNGRTIFDGLISAMTDAEGVEARPNISYRNSITALRDFCQNAPGKAPDIVMTTMGMRSSIATECSKNGFQDIAAIELGRGALILAVRSGSQLTNLTSRQIYLALARDVPDKDEFHRNTAIRWSDIDRSLPPLDIRFQLPPRENGSRAMFDALILQAGCRQEKLVKQIYNAEHRTARCVTTRIDRVREIPRDQAVRALLNAPEGTVGVFTYLEILQSGGLLTELAIDGVAPSRENILQAVYEYSTSYWLYAKRDQTQRDNAAVINAAVERVVTRAASEAMIGPNGVLPGLGLVPLPDDERAQQRADLAAKPQSFDFTSAIGWVASAVAVTASDAWNLVGMGSSTQEPADTRSTLDLTTLMDIAGYKVKEFDSTFGIIPGANMTFGMAREMSEADEEYLERVLYHDAHRRHGILSAIQRRIVQTILDVNEGGDYQVNNVEIGFLPLPQVKLTVSPVDAAMSVEATWLMRAIDELGDRISELGR